MSFKPKINSKHKRKKKDRLLEKDQSKKVTKLKRKQKSILILNKKATNKRKRKFQDNTKD